MPGLNKVILIGKVRGNVFCTSGTASFDIEVGDLLVRVVSQGDPAKVFNERGSVGRYVYVMGKLFNNIDGGLEVYASDIHIHPQAQ